MKKPRQPGRITAEDDEFFERTAVAELERLPASAWPKMLLLWRGLDVADRATAARILTRAVRLCAEQGVPPPKALAVALENHLIPKGASRNRARKPEAHETAIKLLAEGASHPAVAKAVEVSRQAVDMWIQDPDFQKRVAEARFLVDHQRRYEVLRAYRERFGDTFEYERESSMIPLANAVPLMRAALDGGPLVTTAMVEKIAAELRGHSGNQKSE